MRKNPQHSGARGGSGSHIEPSLQRNNDCRGRTCVGTCVDFSTVPGVGRSGDCDGAQLVPYVHKALVLVLGEGVQASVLRRQRQEGQVLVWLV